MSDPKTRRVSQKEVRVRAQVLMEKQGIPLKAALRMARAELEGRKT